MATTVAAIIFFTAIGGNSLLISAEAFEQESITTNQVTAVIDNTAIELTEDDFFTDYIKYPISDASINDLTPPLLSVGNYYDISNGKTYNAKFTGLNSQWLYTNKYFNCSSSGRIYVKYKVRLEAWYAADFHIQIYDLTMGTFYNCTAKRVESIPNYTVDEMYFMGLNPDHYYAVAFRCTTASGEFETIRGGALIGQSHISGTPAVE